MAKKRITREDFAGLRLLRPTEEKRADRMYAQGNDGYNPYGYIKDGGTLPEVTVYGYYDSGDDGWKWSSGIPPWGDTDNPFIDREYPGDESDIWFDIYGEDYYYYNSPYYDVYDTEVGGGHNPQKDGVDVTNADHFFFENTKDNPAFHKQLTKILESNSMLKELLTYFDRGYVSMILQLGTFTEDDEIGSAAITKYDSNTGLYSIKFNEECLDENGWKDKPSGVDAYGFDWNQVRTKEEALVIILTHESMHARHFAIYNSICNDISEKTGLKNIPGSIIYNVMKNRGYSEEFISIFITNDMKPQYDDNKMHSFIYKIISVTP